MLYDACMRKPVTAAPSRPPAAREALKSIHEQLFKGALLVVIGLAVLLAPGFMADARLREVVSGGALAGWFSLVLGAVLCTQGLIRRQRLVRDRL